MGIIRTQIEHQRMRAALQELAQCNLTTENYASLEIASARVRAIALRGLKASAPDGARDPLDMADRATT